MPPKVLGRSFVWQPRAAVLASPLRPWPARASLLRFAGLDARLERSHEIANGHCGHLLSLGALRRGLIRKGAQASRCLVQDRRVEHPRKEVLLDEVLYSQRFEGRAIDDATKLCRSVPHDSRSSTGRRETGTQ